MVRTWRKLLAALTQFGDNREALNKVPQAATALADLTQIRDNPQPYGQVNRIEPLVATVTTVNEQLQQLWQRERRTVVFVTHSIAEAVYLSTRIVIMSPRPGRIVKVIESSLPDTRTLDMRDSAEFVQLAHEVREALAHGHDA